MKFDAPMNVRAAAVPNQDVATNSAITSSNQPVLSISTAPAAQVAQSSPAVLNNYNLRCQTAYPYGCLVPGTALGVPQNSPLVSTAPPFDPASYINSYYCFPQSNGYLNSPVAAATMSPTVFEQAPKGVNMSPISTVPSAFNQVANKRESYGVSMTYDNQPIQVHFANTDHAEGISISGLQSRPTNPALVSSTME